MSALLLPSDPPIHLGTNVIVRPGDWPKMCPLTDPTECNGEHCDCSLHAPQDWVALTGPCPTCKGTGNRNYDVDLDDMIVDDVSDEDCPDCRDGRRIVPLYTECEACGGDVNSASTCGVLDCFAGKRLVGWGSIEVVLPVVASIDNRHLDPPFIEVERSHAYWMPTARASTELLLDPLPVPGRDFGIVIDVTELA